MACLFPDVTCVAGLGGFHKVCYWLPFSLAIFPFLSPTVL